MFDLLSKMLGAKARRSQSKSIVKSAAKPQVEQLEDRLVPATFNTLISSSGAMIIVGTSGNDNVSVQWLNGKYTVYGNTNGVTKPAESYDDSRVNRIYFYGYGGNDSFGSSRTRIYTEAYGGEGNDILAGGAAGDYLDGGNGYDTLKGNGGADTLIGGAHNDILYGHAGNDNLKGGLGDDTLYGGDNDDMLTGDAGNDILKGELGNDVLYGLAGNDQLWGSDGSDKLFGGDGNDLLSGDWGNDFLYGEKGYDHLYGGGNNDYLSGGIDGIADFMHGGIGADRFKGEWVPSSTIVGLYRNLDLPRDFSVSEGDSVEPRFEIALP